METKVAKHYFEYGTVKYFRGKAENVQIGSYGEKKDPIGAIAYLDVQARVKAEHLDGRVHYVTTIDVDWEDEKEAAVEANGDLKFFGLSKKVALNGSYEKAKSARLKLVKFAINEGPLKTMLNQDAGGARNFLAKEGKDGRIVSEIWVAMEAELAEHFATSGSISVGAGAAGSSLEVSASGGRHGSQTVVLSPGTTFAYKLHKVKSWNKDKTRIEDLEADYKGMQ